MVESGRQEDAGGILALEKESRSRAFPLVNILGLLSKHGVAR
jgi:hypothetical protein